MYVRWGLLSGSIFREGDGEEHFALLQLAIVVALTRARHLEDGGTGTLIYTVNTVK